MNEDSKTIVFYQPLFSKSRIRLRNSGTLVRPEAIKNAMLSKGYHVYTISGSFADRRNLSKKICKDGNIVFTYCESANVPFALSGEHHFPMDFFCDFSNLIRLRKKAPVGFFYRDINWKERNFKNKNGIIKGSILYALFWIEYYLLINIVDVLYVPTLEMAEQFPSYQKYKAKMIPLPPACNHPFFNFGTQNNNRIKMIYSGNTDRDSMYKLDGFFESLAGINSVDVTINTEKFDDAYLEIIKKYDLENNVQISNFDFDEIGRYKVSYDVGLVWQDGPIEDIRKYMPIKLFYYLRMGIPVIGRKHTAYGNFIDENQIGWTFSNLKELKEILCNLNNERELIKIFGENVMNVRNKNTWESRVDQLTEELKKRL